MADSGAYDGGEIKTVLETALEIEPPTVRKVEELVEHEREVADIIRVLQAARRPRHKSDSGSLME